MIPEFPPAVPEVPVADLAEATAYYRDRLLFEIDWVADDIALAGISRDHARLFLAAPPFREGRGNAPPIVFWLNLDSNAGVDALHAAWNAAGAIITSAPESKPWGLHEFFAADLDGNQIRVFHDFATPERETAAASDQQGKAGARR